ncbi:hypothetical protein ACIQ2D_07970 [Lysinibacillus sp. NPDC097287]|uniref:hypothetical protein n=1 Tax=Lysinibacillus sp. NPDC097287 TaxID=3364144 RepID=UPI0038109D73
MSHTAVQHLYFKKFLGNLNTTSAHSRSMKLIGAFQFDMQNPKLEKLKKKFIKSLFKQAPKKFFLHPTENENEPSIYLVSKSLKSVMAIAMDTTNKKHLSLYNSPYILHLRHIHSYRKGEGRELMQAYKEIQKELNIPGALYAESEELVDYYKQFGFENLGKLGDSGEFLMKLPVGTK